MISTSVFKFIGLISLITILNSSAYADMIEVNSEQYPAGISVIESEIKRAAESIGLESSNISIVWTKTSSEGYRASIICINSNKCIKKEATLNFTVKEIQTIQSSQLQNQLLKNQLKSIFNEQVR